jgi:hypothetical protein
MNLLSVLFQNYQESQGHAGTSRSALECFGFGIADTSPLELWATVIDPITPGQLGHVLFQGAQWRACSDFRQTLAKGATVQVIDRQSNILKVAPY